MTGLTHGTKVRLNQDGIWGREKVSKIPRVMTDALETEMVSASRSSIITDCPGPKHIQSPEAPELRQHFFSRLYVSARSTRTSTCALQEWQKAQGWHPQHLNKWGANDVLKQRCTSLFLIKDVGTGINSIFQSASYFKSSGKFIKFPERPKASWKYYNAWNKT